MPTLPTMSTISAGALRTIPPGRRVALRRFPRLPMLFISWPQTDKNHHQTFTFHTPKIDDLLQNTGDRPPNCPRRKKLRFSSSRPTPRRTIPLPDPAARSDLLASDRQNHHQTFTFRTPQNRRSPAKHWRSSPQLPSTKKTPFQFKPAHSTTNHPVARPGSPLRSFGLRPTKPSPNFHFSYPQNRRSPAKHWRSSPERRRKKICRIPAHSGRLCAAPTAGLRSAQTARLSQTTQCRTNPNAPSTRSSARHWRSR